MDAELFARRERVCGCADVQLMAELQKLVRVDRRCEARILMCLAEVDARKVFLELGHASLFSYATAVLRMSEAQTYLRIQAARLARRYPVIYDLLVQGELNLSTLKLLDRHLTAENHEALLERARNKTKNQVELLVAEISPRPAVPTRMRKLPSKKAPRQATADLALLQCSGEPPSAAHHSSTCAPETNGATQARNTTDMRTSLLAPSPSPSPSPSPDDKDAHAAATGARVPRTFVLEAPRASLTVLRPRHYKFEMTAGQSLHDKLRQLQHLLRHQVPDGDLGVIVDRALDELHAKLRRQRFAQVSKPKSPTDKSTAVTAASSSKCAENTPATEHASPRPPQGKDKSRHIPSAIKREVFARDGGQCTFVSASGHRCNERGMLEFHHVHAFALGGKTTLTNLKLVCRAHNNFFAIQDFGTDHMRLKRTGPTQRSLF